MNITPAKKENIEEIVRLCTKLWREHQKIDPDFVLHPDIQNTQRRWLREAISSRDAEVLVANEDNRLIAVGTATINRSNIFWPERFGYIRDVFVEENYRNRGIGSALANRLLKWLKQRGIDWVELVALTKNDQASKFWQNLGFNSLFNIYRKDLGDG